MISSLFSIGVPLSWLIFPLLYTPFHLLSTVYLPNIYKNALAIANDHQSKNVSHLFGWGWYPEVPTALRSSNWMAPRYSIRPSCANPENDEAYN